MGSLSFLFVQMHGKTPTIEGIVYMTSSSSAIKRYPRILLFNILPRFDNI